MFDAQYDPHYNYYFTSPENVGNDFEISNYENAFAVLNDDNNLIGFISYYCKYNVRLAYAFSAINFSDDKKTFALALMQVISDCFLKFGFETIEWSCVCGNPIEKKYDRICEKIGGRILCIKKRRAMTPDEQIHDKKFYEVTKEDFIETTHKK